MHSVFRIGEITKIGNNSSLYQVNLTLAADDDQELRILTDRIRNEVAGKTGWERLGQLLIKLNEFDKAEELYIVLLEQTLDTSVKAIYYHQLGTIKGDQGDYEKAIEYYEKALENFDKALPPNHPNLTTSYNNIAQVYYNMGAYSKALSYLERAFDIYQRSLPPNRPNIKNAWQGIEIEKKKLLTNV